MRRVLHIIWGLIPKGIHWRLLWFLHSKFNVGISVVAFNSKGEVLMLKHVYRTNVRWEVPSGWMSSGETFAQAAVREIHEETGLKIDNVVPIRVVSGFILRLEIVVSAKVCGQDDIVCSSEVFSGSFFPVSNLPTGVSPFHSEIINQACKNEGLK